jgi:hypothetical protein
MIRLDSPTIISLAAPALIQHSSPEQQTLTRRINRSTVAYTTYKV